MKTDVELKFKRKTTIITHRMWLITKSNKNTNICLQHSAKKAGQDPLTN